MTSSARHLYYWILPALVMSLLVAMYFSGQPWLVDFISPPVGPWGAHGNRELGLVETAQHLMLLAIALIFVRGAWRAEAAVQRIGCVLLALLFTAMLLEELDYGLHYYEWWQGRIERKIPGERNLHNRGDTTQTLKVIADAANLLWFVVLPLVALRLRQRWLSYLAPSVWILSTVAVALLISQMAHELRELGLEPRLPDGRLRLALAYNVSEFRETVVYYIWLLYVHEIVNRRRWPLAQ